MPPKSLSGSFCFPSVSNVAAGGTQRLDRIRPLDTCIPLDILKEISDYDYVAVMLSPQSMSVERFFDRSDPEKQFLLRIIDSCENRDAVMENYRRGLERISSQAHYDEYANSGFSPLCARNMGRIPGKRSAIGLHVISD